MVSKKILAAALLVTTFSSALILFSFQSPFKRTFDVVRVDGGLISGTVNSDGDIHIFKGIPFAAPPVGVLRWKAPQPVIPWKGVKRCNAFGASPMQGAPVPFGPWSEEYLIPKSPISEDCLYLNVWTGATAAKEKRPVLVWIYGGGFVSGGSGVPVYDGEATAKKGIVFVSVNYRVGIFGFFAHPELTKESGHNASGNYGLMDQIAALKWVKKNIAAFGGDPDKVTIAGQSAGSMSVNCLVASPLCKGLFKRAIAESGASFIKSGLTGDNTLSRAEAEGMRIAQSFHAATTDDLRKIPAKDLMKVNAAFRSPVIDGYVLPESIADIFKENKQNDVALLTGWNEDDGVVFGKPQPADEFKKQAEKNYGDDTSKFFQLYPAHTDEEAAASQAMLSRDMIFGIQNYTWANEQSEKSRYKVYVYRFARKLPATGDYKKYGAFHTGEVAYAYDNLDFVHRCPWEQTDRDLAKTMSWYWANFIITGDPNGKNLPEWPAYNTKDFSIMLLDEHPHAASLPGKKGLDFLIAKMK
ncbi:MAG TPA: carboxylesterase family protein [Chitinophagaceae bacterium]|nr:carboxylesterase family protein [Chitinophagaceae bacterium]